MVALLDVLQTLGVRVTRACTFATPTIKANDLAKQRCQTRTTRRECVASLTGATPSFIEVYGRGGLTDAAQKFKGLNVVGLRVLDLISHRPDGEKWDFTKTQDRKWAKRLVEQEDPDWITTAPQCTSFSVLNHGLNFPRMSDSEVQKRWKEVMIHMDFVC